MTTLPVSHVAQTSAPLHPETSPARAVGVLLIGDALLAFAPVAILGPAIGWPASLASPAATQLAAIHAHGDVVMLGYSLYLLYSILIAPVMIGVSRRVFGRGDDAMAESVAAFAALSTLARCIGILRWLTVMPALAASHATADPAMRLQIETLFDAITRYGGGIGDVLGVSLFMALAVGTLAAGALRSGGMPRWLSWAGLVVAALLASLTIPALGGPALVPVAVAVTALSAWMIATGAWCWRKPQGKPNGAG